MAEGMAVRQAFPVYQSEIVGLLKSTAIVGYIAVQDLTKMADIIRAQTFDAFVPLIVITVMYLAFVSSRILYMDDGGIYEDGTPEEIFNRPQKERTRQFIYQLKVLTINIDSPDFDFYGFNAEIVDYEPNRVLLHVQNR